MSGVDAGARITDIGRAGERAQPRHGEQVNQEGQSYVLAPAVNLESSSVTARPQ